MFHCYKCLYSAIDKPTWLNMEQTFVIVMVKKFPVKHPRISTQKRWWCKLAAVFAIRGLKLTSIVNPLCVRPYVNLTSADIQCLHSLIYDDVNRRELIKREVIVEVKVGLHITHPRTIEIITVYNYCSKSIAISRLRRSLPSKHTGWWIIYSV